MDKEKDNPLEVPGKLIAQQDKETRNVSDFMSKAKTFANIQWLLDYKTCCENIAMQLISSPLLNLSGSERHRLIEHYLNKIIECNKALNQVGLDAIKDEIISKLTEMASHK